MSVVFAQPQNAQSQQRDFSVVDGYQSVAHDDSARVDAQDNLVGGMGILFCQNKIIYALRFLSYDFGFMILLIHNADTVRRARDRKGV